MTDLYFCRIFANTAVDIEPRDTSDLQQISEDIRRIQTSASPGIAARLISLLCDFWMA